MLYRHDVGSWAIGQMGGTLMGLRWEIVVPEGF